MENGTIAEHIDNIAVQVALEHGVEFVHAEIAGTKRNLTVRIFIDKPGGVNVEDCTTVSRGIEAVLDVDDVIPSAYLLEVSSPGLERGLYSLGDFEKFTGKLARVKTNEEVGGQKNFTGRIIGVEDGDIIFDDRTAGTVRFKFETVEKANLKVDLAAEFKRR